MALPEPETPSLISLTRDQFTG
ncbi:hypothetical protein CCACVL1_17312 [Corchorus capsularis]|uniref:Uncharacterized protein n=1 Tax=Corchorus capsularis TaxID=210143 RepID=A0A1R3HSL0_COCAP|nr:hypothetical protein CCACVL1_17312 [Corchorus capsularis]